MLVVHRLMRIIKYHSHTYIHTYMHTYIHICMHTHMHARIHIHAHTHTHTHTFPSTVRSPRWADITRCGYALLLNWIRPCPSGPSMSNSSALGKIKHLQNQKYYWTNVYSHCCLSSLSSARTSSSWPSSFMANLDPSAPILSRQTVSSSTATQRDGQTTIVALLGNSCAMALQPNTPCCG